MKRRLHFLSFVCISVVLVLTMVLRQPTQAAATCAESYTVRRGDTLFRIGLRFGLRWTVLQALNGLRNPNFILVGEHLCIRRSGQPRVATAASNQGTGGNSSTLIMNGGPHVTRSPGSVRWI